MHGFGARRTCSRYLRSLRTSLPHAKLVILSDDVHHVRLLKEAEDEGRPPGRHVERVKEEELKHYFYADHVLCISELDKGQILRSLPPTKAMHDDRFSVLRHVYADGVLYPLEHRRPFEQRRGLVFVGNLNNPTNLQGLLWFLREAWPRVRAAEPSITLRVVGSLDRRRRRTLRPDRADEEHARRSRGRLCRRGAGQGAAACACLHRAGALGDGRGDQADARACARVPLGRHADGSSSTWRQHRWMGPLEGGRRVVAYGPPLCRSRSAEVAETAAEYAHDGVARASRMRACGRDETINGARYVRAAAAAARVCAPQASPPTG